MDRNRKAIQGINQTPQPTKQEKIMFEHDKNIY